MPECKKCGASFVTGPEVGAHARAEHAKSAEEEVVPYWCYLCSSTELHRHEPNKQAAYDATLRMLERFGSLERRSHDSYGNVDDKLACYLRRSDV